MIIRHINYGENLCMEFMYELLRGVIVGSIFMLLFFYYSYWFAIQCFFGGAGL